MGFREDINRFASEYIPDVEYLRPHQLDWLEQIHNGGKRVLVLAPRGHGKSTIIRTYIMFRICHDPEIKILMASHVESLAKLQARAIQMYIELPNIQTDFGFSKGRPWSVSTFHLAGMIQPVMATVAARGGMVGKRFDLVIFDDLLSLENCINETSREKILNWIRAEVLPAIDPFDPQKDAKSREAKLASVLGVPPVMRAVGCRTCAGTGYLHQIPVPEVLVVTSAMRAVLAKSPSDAELLRCAQADGMRTFAEVGLDRVAKGETTVEELERVLGVVPIRDETADSVGPVLVVDDEQQDRLIVSSVLREMGFQVVERTDAASAKELLDSGDEMFSMVLMDLYMPGMDGSELLRSIRQSLSTQSLPVVVLTSSGNPRDEVELLEAGADDFLLKPVVVERLEARVRAVLRRSGVRIAGDGTD